MRYDWIFDEAPWEIASSKIAAQQLGGVKEVCIHAIGGDGVGTEPAAMLQAWQGRLVALLGPVAQQTVLQAAAGSAVSGLWRHASGTIVRLFADRGVVGASPALDFEVIGGTHSLIHRTSCPSTAVFQHTNGPASATTRLIRTDPCAADLRREPAGQPPLRLGVISLDHPHAVGNHFPALLHLGHAVHVTAIAEHDADKARPWLATFNAAHYPDRDALLTSGDVDAVLITSTNDRHAQDSIACLRAGKDVFCDKPLATSAKDAAAIVEAARQTNRRVVTTFPCRWHPAVQELRQWLNEGRLGQILAVAITNHGCMYLPNVPDWVRDPKRNGGGCLIDHTVHAADLIRYLTGQEFIDATTLAASCLQGIPAEDIAVSHGHMGGGILWQIDSSWSRRATDPVWGDFTVRLIGSQGAASLDPYNHHPVQVYTPSGVELHFSNPLTHQHGRIFTSYMAAVRRGIADDNADAVDGLRTIELVEACYDSVRQGGVSVKVQSQFSE